MVAERPAAAGAGEAAAAAAGGGVGAAAAMFMQLRRWLDSCSSGVCRVHRRNEARYGGMGVWGQQVGSDVPSRSWGGTCRAVRRRAMACSKLCGPGVRVLQVAVVVESEDMRTGVRHHCCSAHLTFVVRPQLPTAAGGAVGAAAGGAAAPGLPRVVPTSSEHRAVWEGAEVRRQQRLERRARARQDPALRDMERVCRWAVAHRGAVTFDYPQSKC